MSEESKIAADIMTQAVIELQEGTYEHCAGICDKIAERYWKIKHVDHRNQDRGFIASECARAIREVAKSVGSITKEIAKEAEREG